MCEKSDHVSWIPNRHLIASIKKLFKFQLFYVGGSFIRWVISTHTSDDDWVPAIKTFYPTRYIYFWNLDLLKSWNWSSNFNFFAI